MKYLKKLWNRGPFIAWLLKILQNGFKVIYRDQTTIETSTLPTIWIFKKSTLIFSYFFKTLEYLFLLWRDYLQIR